VRDGDVLTLRRLLSDVDHHGVVNCALSDAVPCSALSYAARCGYPEIVDTLVDMPGCQIDGVDRTKRSALDEAIGGWAAAALDADGGRQQDCSTGKRCRIVRRLLAAGARSLSRPALDVVLSSALHDDDNGQQFTRKLVTVRTLSLVYFVRTYAWLLAGLFDIALLDSTSLYPPQTVWYCI